MDITTLALTAYTLAQPFLSKTGEGIARKVGEDIWNLIKKPFIKKGVDDVTSYARNNEENFKLELQDEIANNPDFAKELSQQLVTAQSILSGNFQQSINNNEKVEKQINIQHNTGNINM